MGSWDLRRQGLSGAEEGLTVLPLSYSSGRVVGMAAWDGWLPAAAANVLPASAVIAKRSRSSEFRIRALLLLLKLVGVVVSVVLLLVMVLVTLWVGENFQRLPM